jgi:peptide/nickel transport system permease protein
MAAAGGSRDVFRHLARRFVWGLTIIWMMLSATWLLIQFKPERGGPMGGFQPGSGQLGENPLQEYLEWLIDYLTLNWGPEVLSTWETTVPVTLAYLFPALVGAAILGILVATYGAMVPGGWVDRGVSTTSHLGIGIPTFVLVEAAIAVAPQYGIIIEPYDRRLDLLHPDNVIGLAVPMLMLGLPLFAYVTRYARQEALAQRTAEYVKTARAKGAGRIRVAAHVLRNAWLALVHVVFSELIGLILLGTIVIEIGFEMPGFAWALFDAFEQPNQPLIISAALVAVMFGVLGTWIQDVGRLYLVPERNE